MMRFEVKNLGKIASADIELAPLLILVGKNNTGKSFLSSLIWSLGSIHGINSIKRAMRRPQWFNDFLAGISPNQAVQLHVDAEMAGEVKKIVQAKIKGSLPDFLARVFAFDGFTKTQLKITEFAFEPFTINIIPEKGRTARETEMYIRISVGDYPPSFRGVIFSFPVDDFDRDQLFDEVVGYILFGRDWPKFQSQIYIPAARTGIMLALQSLLQQSLLPESQSAVELPQPLRQFLRSMTRPHPTGGEKKSEIRERLARRLMAGEIKSQSARLPSYRYVPAGSSLQLPLHATSSMITELAPLMVALDRPYPETRHIIFEEPEAHLHLEAQREIARVIARLVNSGSFVTLTTHSDTFVQQINNLMKLHEHPGKRKLMDKLGYEESDLIDPEMTRAYEFCPSDEGTSVRALVNGDEGFIVPSLNETLMALAKETLMLRRSNDD